MCKWFCLFAAFCGQMYSNCDYFITFSGIVHPKPHRIVCYFKVYRSRVYKQLEKGFMCWWKFWQKLKHRFNHSLFFCSQTYCIDILLAFIIIHLYWLLKLLMCSIVHYIALYQENETGYQEKYKICKLVYPVCLNPLYQRKCVSRIFANSWSFPQ